MLYRLLSAGDATVSVFAQFEDGGGNVAKGEDGIRPSQFDRLAGHPPYYACFLVLNHRGSAGVVHLFQTVCPITPHAGEQDANGIVPSVLSDRAKQDVHRGSVTIDRWTVVQPTHIACTVACHEQMAIAWCNIGMAWQDLLSILRLTHGHRRDTVHASGKGPTKCFGDMLGNHHPWRSRRQVH